MTNLKEQFEQVNDPNKTEQQKIQDAQKMLEEIKKK